MIKGGEQSKESILPTPVPCTSLPAAKRCVVMITIHRGGSFFWMPNQEIQQLESQAVVLQVGAAVVLGDDVVTMSLKLFWVDHFQVPYALCCPIPSFISQFWGKVCEAKIAYPDNPSQNLGPTGAHNSRLGSHWFPDLSLSSIKHQTYKASVSLR